MTVLALGADSAGSACFADESLHMTEPVGDLSFLENFQKYKENIEKIVKTKPGIIACDMHPGYISTEYAEELAKRYSAKLVKVQHHKAHVATVAYEHNLKEYVGIACDGLGFGEDNKLWGGEVFLVKGNKTERIGHLEEQPQLGGDSAAVYPMKMLFGILTGFMDKNDLLNFYDQNEIKLYSRQLSEKYNVQTTTSTGRILDSVSAMLGICREMTYPGEPAIMLEKHAKGAYDIKPVIKDNILLTRPLFQYLAKNIGKDTGKLAGAAQMYIAHGLYDIAKRPGLPVVFSGGVAYNNIISGFMQENRVLLNLEIPPGDAGICAGQAILASQKQKRQTPRHNV